MANGEQRSNKEKKKPKKEKPKEPKPTFATQNGTLGQSKSKG